MKRKQEQAATRALEKLKGPVIRELRHLIDTRQASHVCRTRLNGLQPSRITEIASGKRPLTPYYLTLFIEKGIVTMDHVLQGKTIEDMPEDLQPVLERLMMPLETVRLFLAVKEKGMSYDEINDHFKYLLKLKS